MPNKLNCLYVEIRENIRTNLFEIDPRLSVELFFSHLVIYN